MKKRRRLSASTAKQRKKALEITGIHRNTISKYVYGLEKEGKLVNTRQVENAKFCTVKEAK